MPKKRTLSTSLHLRLDPTTLNRLIQHSKMEKRSMSNAARKIIEEALSAGTPSRAYPADLRAIKGSGIQPTP